MDQITSEDPGAGWFLYMLKLIETGFRPSLEQALSAHGLSAAQYTALSVLRTRPGITSSELARRSFVRAQSMAETVSVMQERRWITRDQDPTHARRLLLHTAPEGLRVLAAVEEPVSRTEAQLLEGLSREAADQLALTLRTMRRNLRQLNNQAP
ncbi:MarR family transcriptional regulator [Nesterenkonia pannonica]|uniref:MarR family winged helix-turn-helix transcriptional regulator n=1 Tax=Nesterenkonia pannonica TaxID=1548602 RepID=UPI0021646F08|nr:MarR family transcriptional regulator [Nesterenkonia pannonica]